MYRVMVVDDEPYMREGMRLLIDWESHGFVLAGEAENATQALEMLAAERFDLLVCDVCMPGMPGTELAQAVHLHYPEMAIAFISGHQDFSYAQAAIRAQAYCYLLKPIDPDEIHQRLREIAGRLGRGRKRSPDMAGGNAVQTPEKDPQHRMRDALHRYVDQQYCKKPSLAALASELCLHQGYLGQWIKRDTGHTFHQHITQRRIQEAQRLLRQSAMSVKEIALSVGISDIDYFSSQFRQLVGKTPKQFRKG